MTAASRHAPGGAPILGRANACARLLALLEDDTPVAIVGEAGVGKTTLARTVLGSAGRPVSEGGGFATLAWMPWFALERALGRNLRGIASSAMAGEVIRVVGDGVLFIDDLHWVDAATRALIAELAGRIGLVVGVRLGDPETEAAISGLPQSVVRLDLEPLEEADAIELVRRVRPDLGQHAARTVARRAGGNPLLVTELAAGGEDAVTLAAAVRVRLDALDSPAREAMAMLSLSGHPMSPAALGPGAGQLASVGLAIVDAAGESRAAGHRRRQRLMPATADAPRRSPASGRSRSTRPPDHPPRALHDARTGRRVRHTRPWLH